MCRQFDSSQHHGDPLERAGFLFPSHFPSHFFPSRCYFTVPSRQYGIQMKDLASKLDIAMLIFYEQNNISAFKKIFSDGNSSPKSVIFA